MAVPTRIELAIFCVTGRRDNRYTTGPYGCGGKIWTYDLRVMSPTSYRTAPLRDIKLKMAERKGFEPLRQLPDLPVFKTGPFNQTWVFLQHKWCLRPDLNRHEVWPSQDFKSCASTNSATQALYQKGISLYEQFNGVPYRTRICDPLIKSQMLYQLS